MDALTLVLALVAVVMLAVGGYLAVNVPRAIRQAGSSVIVRAFGALLLGGVAIGLLGLGGAILAALVGAAAVTVWLSLAFTAGALAFALAALGFILYAVWRRVAGKQRTAVR
jgi:hypothetical protein